VQAQGESSFDASFNWLDHDDANPAPANPTFEDKAKAEAESNARWRAMNYHAYLLSGGNRFGRRSIWS
jgi:hypothetical protein